MVEAQRSHTVLTPEVVREVTGAEVRSQVLGSAVTTFAIGGPLRFVVDVTSPRQLSEVSSLFSRSGETPRALGAGSNLLVGDSGVNGWVVRFSGAMREVTFAADGQLTAGAGASLLRLSRDASDAGLSGLEFAGGIPGSVGGAVVMNAGAHGGEFADRVTRVEVVLPGGEAHDLRASELRFAYRHAELPKGAIISRVWLQLMPGDRQRSMQLRASCLAERKARQPLQYPSAGSVFRNPDAERSAGFLIEMCGLKGARQGGAVVSEMHANWIVNPDRKATAEDVRALIDRCQRAVAERFSVQLRREVIDW